jgi:hypothetical protein
VDSYSIVELTNGGNIKRSVLKCSNIQEAYKQFLANYIDTNHPYNSKSGDQGDTLTVEATPNREYAKNFNRMGQQMFFILNDKDLPQFENKTTPFSFLMKEK